MCKQMVTASGISLLAIFYYLHRIFSLLKLDPHIFKWTAAAIFLGSALLPFGLVYNNHPVEAVFIFASFYYLLDYRIRRNKHAPVIVGVLICLTFLVHGYAGCIFMGLSGLYFLFARFRDLVKFVAVTLLVLILGMGLNKVINGEYKSFYYMPETYIYKGSYWLTYPVQPGLTGEQIYERFEEMNLPKYQMREYVMRYIAFRDQYQGNPRFMWERLLKRDYLTFNVIFLFGLFSSVLCLIRKDFEFKREVLWVLLGTLAMYVLIILQGAMEGQSFGSGYLIPHATLLALFTAFGMKIAPNPGFFKIAIWPTMALHIAGTIKPWQVPTPAFQRVGLIFFVVILVLFFVTFFVKRADQIFEAFAGFMAKRMMLTIIIFAGLILMGQWSFTVFEGYCIPWTQWGIFLAGAFLILRLRPKT